MIEFVVDADSNYFIPEVGVDQNLDGKLDGADENVYPGFVIEDFNTPDQKRALLAGSAVYNVNTDQWGSWISGVAPIYDKNGKMMGILGVDFDMTLL